MAGTTTGSVPGEEKQPLFAHSFSSPPELPRRGSAPGEPLTRGDTLSGPAHTSVGGLTPLTLKLCSPWRFSQVPACGDIYAALSPTPSPMKLPAPLAFPCPYPQLTKERLETSRPVASSQLPAAAEGQRAKTSASESCSARERERRESELVRNKILGK